MRLLSALVLAIVAAGLGYVQVVATIVLRERAQPGSWVRVVPASVAARVDALDPAWPMPQALLDVLARRALDDGALGRAEGAIAHLDPSPERRALEGRLAEARGDGAAAERAYLAADDLEDLQRRVERLRAAMHTAEAVHLERKLVEHLSHDPTQRDTLAQAYYDLGNLEETEAYRFALGASSRAAHERLAGEAYRNAVAIAPVEERYVLADANQQLNLGNLAAARASFLRAREIDPQDPQAAAGLAAVARLDREPRR